MTLLLIFYPIIRQIQLNLFYVYLLNINSLILFSLSFELLLYLSKYTIYTYQIFKYNRYLANMLVYSLVDRAGSLNLIIYRLFCFDFVPEQSNYCLIILLLATYTIIIFNI